MSATLTAIFNAQDRISNTLSGIDKRGNDLTNTLGKLAATAGAVFSAKQIVDFGKTASIEFVDFQGGMSEVFTLLPEISESAMGKMTADVKDFAKEMGTLPDKVVPALYQSLSAGVPKGNVFDFMETANKAAVGGVTELETAVDGLSSVTNAYGIKVLSTQKASDLMFTTVKLGKTTFGELSSSLFNVVPTAVGANVAFSDISASLAAMTAQGIPTSVATTQLRQAIVELSSAGSETDKTFRKVVGKGFKDFMAGGGDLQEAFQKLEGYAKKSNLGVNDLFGSVEAGSAVLALTGQGTEKFTQAMEGMASSAGATDAAFDTMEGSMSRKIAKMQSAWKVTKLDVGEALLDSFMPVFEWTSENMDDLSGGVRKFFDYIGKGAGAAWKMISPMLSWIKENPELVSASIGGIGAAIITYKVATGIQSVALAMKAFNLSVLFSPVGIITAVAAGLVAVGIAVYNTEKRLAKASLDAHFGSVALSTADLDAAVRHILKNDSLGKLDKAFKAFDALSSVRDSITQAIETVEKLNWKVGIGMELTVDEKTEYKNAIDDFVKNSIKVVEDKQYAITLAVDAYFGDSPLGSEFKTSIDQFYSGYKDKLTVLGQQLQEAVLVGYQNGWSIDSTQAVNNIMKSMTEITDKIAQAQSEAKIQALQLDFISGDLSAESFEKMQSGIKTELDSLKTKFNDTRINVIAQAHLNFELPEGSEGKIDETKMNEIIQTAQDNYQKAVSDLAVKGLNFQTDTITKAFGDELSNAIVGDGSSVSDATRAAISELFKGMQPTIEEVQEIASGYDIVPPAISNALFGASALGTFSNDSQAMSQSLATIIKTILSQDDATWQGALETLNQTGMSLPQKIIDGMDLQRQNLIDMGAGLGNDTLDSLKTNLENGIDANIPVNATVNMNVTATSGIDGNATGTDYASNMFIAGEHGPELIVGAEGSTVFTNSDTRRMLSTTSRPVDFSDNPAKSDKPDSDSGMVTGDKQITLTIQGSGAIKVDGRMDKDSIVDVMVENIKPVLLKLLKDEVFEEGDLAYEY